MRIFNITGHHLTGADKRFLAREYRRQRNGSRRTFVNAYGTEKGAAMWMDVNRRQETMLTQEEADGETLVGTAAFVRHDGGGLCLDGVGAAKGHRVFSRPIVRI